MHKIRSQELFRRMLASKLLSFSYVFVLPVLALFFSLPLIVFSLVSSVNNSSAIAGETAVTAGIVRPAFSVFISVPSVINLDLSPNADGLMTVGSSSVYAGTSSPNGYRLYLSMTGTNSDTNALIHATESSKTITSTGTYTDPVALTNGKWGYALSHTRTADNPVVSDNGFDTSYTAFESGAPTSAKFASVPYGNSPAQRIAETDAIGDNDLTVYYAVRAGYETASGTYSNKVLYTTLADNSPVHTAFVVPSTIFDEGGESITVTTPLFTTVSSVTANVYLLTADQYNAVTRQQNPVPVTDYDTSSKLTCSRTASDSLELSCTTRAIAAGNQYVYVDLPEYTESYAASVTVLPKYLTVNVSNTNTTSGAASVQVPYGSSATVTVTPSSGYYLGGVTCPQGYTCSGYTTGSSATGQQTVTIANNNTATGGTIAFTGTMLSFNVTISKTNVTTNPTSTVSVPYGGSGTVTVTPSTGYILKSVSCPSGYTCTGYTIGATSQQTITITNNNTTSGGTLTLTGALPFNGITQMQQMTSTICNNASIGESATLTDSRDTNTYTVKKLADGECWMTQNLRLAGPKTLYNTDSNLTTASSWTLPAQNTGLWCINEYSDPNDCPNTIAEVYNTANNVNYGNYTYGSYYNYFAATAGTGPASVTSSTNAPSSICPKGWKLPSYDELLAFGDHYNSRDLVVNGDPQMVMAGFIYYRYGVSSSGSSAVYLSSTATEYSSDSVAGFLVDSYYVGPVGNGGVRTRGNSVRCIAQ